MVDLEIVLGGFALGITGGRHVRSVSETGTEYETWYETWRSMILHESYQTVACIWIGLAYILMHIAQYL